MSLTDLARELVGADPAELRVLMETLSDEEQIVLQQAVSQAEREHMMGLERGAEWRATPTTMANHLTGGRVQMWPYSMLLGEKYVQAVEGVSPRQIWNLPAQYGKALALDTPLPTPTGWTTMGEVVVGDSLLDDQGQPCQVTAKSSVWLGSDCFSVDSKSREPIIADAAHEWRASLDRRISDRLYTTEVLAKQRRRRPMVPLAEPLDLPDADLPIDPYVLGVWLGDGSTAGARISAAPEDAKHIRAEFEAVGYRTTNLSRPDSFGVLRLLFRLRALGVLGNKHVPRAYLRGSISQRRALLQGLIDTDGYVSPIGQVEFCSTLQVLADAVAELVRSLGGQAQVRTGRASLNGQDCGPKWRVLFFLADAARLPRKAMLCRSSGRQHYVKVKQVRSVPTQCLQVDSPSSLFLAGRAMVPTHNSTIASQWGPAWTLELFPEWPLILVSYGDELADRNAYAVRDILRTHDELHTNIRQDMRRRDRFLTMEGGGILAAGVEGTMTGWGARGIIIDDPFKNWQEAHSKARRELVWNQYRSVIRMRETDEDLFIILVMTRWHEDDLTAKLVKEAQAGGEQWEVIRLAEVAEAPDPTSTDPILRLPDPLGREPGEVLEARRFSPAAVDRRRRSAGPYLWAGMHQQRPSPEEGGELKRGWWQVEKSLPPHFDQVISSWDMKMKEKKSGDYQSGQVWGRTGGSFWLLEHLHGQWNMPTVKAGIALLAIRHPEIQVHLIENTGNGPEVMQELREGKPDYQLSKTIGDDLGMAEDERPKVEALLRRGMSGLLPQNPVGDKTARARAHSGTLEAGDVHVLDEPGARALIDEAATFPGEHDDMVDAWSQAMKYMSNANVEVGRPSGARVEQAPPAERAAQLGQPMGSGAGFVDPRRRLLPPGVSLGRIDRRD